MDNWDAAYSGKSESERSWTQRIPSDSLGIIDSISLDPGSAVIDIGGGASYLVDELVNRGFTDVTLLDISPEALDESRERNGDRISYAVANVTTWRPARTFAMWHDRAVFHFLTTEEEQAGYTRAVLEGTTAGSEKKSPGLPAGASLSSCDPWISDPSGPRSAWGRPSLRHPRCRGRRHRRSVPPCPC
ncbi:MAG: class I SAM-dependent methyltransferase [Actinobacteria bacterium]|nr:class I SAM-dependent methyltransferase [Actinomycetota bacterium]